MSRWLGDLPEVTRQARVAEVKVRASPGVVGDPPKSPPECPSPGASTALCGTPWPAPFLPGAHCALTGHPVFCLCLDLPVQILKPATFTDTAHYPLLLVV